MRADLALIGFGHVARRFVRLLEECRPRLISEHDLDCRVVSIATRRHGIVHSADGVDAVRAAGIVESGTDLTAAAEARRSHSLSDSLAAIARLAEGTGPLKVVIETTTLDVRDGQPAIDHVAAALGAGCHVITANKGPVAFAYRILAARAAAAGVAFLFEGTVMDGVPIFNLVRETLPGVEVLGFRGIVNSTTNHILTALEEGESFDAALSRMQAAGIAEADASLDIEGWDAAAKAAALANVLMDAGVTPHDVRRTGIGPWTMELARAVRAEGKRLKLVASATRGSAPVVEPVALDGQDPLAGLRGTANALLFETDLLGEIGVYQFEGSLTQTAYALLTDLVTIRRRAPHEARPHRIP